MNLSKDTVERLVALLREEAAKHQKEINRINSDIAALLNTNIANEVSNSMPESGRKTFKEVINEIFSDGIPRNSRQLQKLFKQITKKELSSGAFSAQLSPMVTKSDGTLKFQTIDGLPIEYRNYYGLRTWFSGDKLKPEYYAKIVKPHEMA